MLQLTKSQNKLQTLFDTPSGIVYTDTVKHFFRRGFIMPFDLGSVPKPNIQETVLGTVEVVLEDGTYYLYNNGIQWMSLSPGIHQIESQFPSYELAYGDVLVTGLGFGALALWLCEKSDVKSVTVIEHSPEVIEIFKKFNVIPNKLTIINSDATTFTTDKKYDGIFLDHYETQHWNWRLKDMKDFCSRVKHDVFWAWSLEEAYMFKTHKLDWRELNSSVENFQYFLDIEDITLGWKGFVESFFPNEKSLLDMSSEKVKEYIYGYYNKPLIEFKAKNFSRGEL